MPEAGSRLRKTVRQNKAWFSPQLFPQAEFYGMNQPPVSSGLTTSLRLTRHVLPLCPTAIDNIPARLRADGLFKRIAG